jgi:hypothetical protein
MWEKRDLFDELVEAFDVLVDHRAAKRTLRMLKPHCRIRMVQQFHDHCAPPCGDLKSAQTSVFAPMLA